MSSASSAASDGDAPGPDDADAGTAGPGTAGPERPAPASAPSAGAAAPESAAPPQLAWHHAALCRLALPLRPPAPEGWSRNAGDLVVQLEPGPGAEELPLPAGRGLRLMLIHLFTAALAGGTAQVELGAGPQAVAERFGLEASEQRLRELREAADRLLSARLRLLDGPPPGLAMLDARAKARAEPDGWRPTLKLNERFLAQLTKQAVPLDARAVGRLAGSVPALDAYVWLAATLPGVPEGQPALHGWDLLRERFADGEPMPARFQEAFSASLEAAREAYPQADFTIGEAGVELRRSPSPVPGLMPPAPPRARARRPRAEPAAPGAPAGDLFPPPRPDAPASAPRAAEAEGAAPRPPAARPRRGPEAPASAAPDAPASLVPDAPASLVPDAQASNIPDARASASPGTARTGDQAGPDNAGPQDSAASPSTAEGPGQGRSPPQPDRPDDLEQELLAEAERRSLDDAQAPPAARRSPPRPAPSPHPEPPHLEPRGEPHAEPRAEPRPTPRREARGERQDGRVALPPSLTGLPLAVWLRRGERLELMTIEVTPGPEFDLRRRAVLAVEPIVLQVSGQLHPRELDRIAAWAVINADLIQEVWEGSVPAGAATLQQVRRLPPSRW